MSGILASDLIKEVCDHDKAILNLLKERYEGFTIIQISNKLKRARNDVKHSIHRLKLGKHVRDYPKFGRVCLVEFDFSEQVIKKRPVEAAEHQRKLEEEIQKLREALLKSQQLINTVGDVTLNSKYSNAEKHKRMVKLFKVHGDDIFLANKQLLEQTK